MKVRGNHVLASHGQNWDLQIFRGYLERVSIVTLSRLGHWLLQALHPGEFAYSGLFAKTAETEDSDFVLLNRDYCHLLLKLAPLP